MVRIDDLPDMTSTVCCGHTYITRNKSASIAQWLEPRPSDPAVVDSSPGMGGYMCLPY